MLIVFNPTAGGRRRQRLDRALQALGRHGVRAEVAETTRPGHATALAREAAGRGVPVVVAAGGDGTIAEVAAGLAGTEARLGILPLGTANVLAWELGVPLAPDRAAAVLATGRLAVLWPGIASFDDGTTRLFVQMLGAGFDAAVVAGLDLRLKRRLGRGAYVVQAAREVLRYRFPRFTAELDGRAETVVSAIVTKGRFYAGRHLLAPDAMPGKAGFQVALFRDAGPLATALYGMALPLGLLSRMPGVVIRAAARVRLVPGCREAEWVNGSARAGLGAAIFPTQSDGDPAGLLPVTIEDAPGPIRVLLPAASMTVAV